MLLHILSIEQQVFSGDITGVSVPTLEGMTTLLDDHTPTTMVLIPGEVNIRTATEDSKIFIGGGFLQVRDGEIFVLADTAEDITSMSVEAANQARVRAEESVAEATTTESLMYAKAELAKSLERLKVVRRHHPHQKDFPSAN